MIISEDYSYTNPQLIRMGYATLDIHSLIFDRYFTEEEMQQNREYAERYGTNSSEWAERCDRSTTEIAKQIDEVLCLFAKYDIHQISADTSSMEHYRSNWDLYYYSNRGWNGKDMADHVTLSFNKNRTVEENMALLAEIVEMLNHSNVDAPNVKCRVQYQTHKNEEKIKAEADAICERLQGQTINHSGITGKIKRLNDCWTFWKLRAKNHYYYIDPVSLIFENIKRDEKETA
ncbi:MAG: hypothetical protein BWY46_01973 [Firmicutes bacterium ADurb.Bin300]|nr:MAG: hypothetical protein BWY46_01973 [Firmicutes bacterium ADurb.Bin300]